MADADRERTIALLRHHTGDGRLDLAELEERVAAASLARTAAELGRVTADLPVTRLPEDVARRARRDRAEALGHLRTYAAVMVLLVVIWAATGADYFWPIWPMLGWGIGVASHVVPALARGQRRALRGLPG